jgi:hypothetical protein
MKKTTIISDLKKRYFGTAFYSLSLLVTVLLFCNVYLGGEKELILPFVACTSSIIINFIISV